MELVTQTLVHGVLIGSLYAAIALGMVGIYSVSGVINFAHGDFLVLGLYLSLALYGLWGLDSYAAILVIVPVFVLVGVAFWRLLIAPIASHHVIMVAQLTLGISFIVQNSLLWWKGADNMRIPSVVDGKVFEIGFLNVTAGSLVVFVVSGLIAASLFVVLKYTNYGRAVRAIEQNRQAAALMGIEVSRVQTWTFAGALAIVAIAAGVLAPLTDFSPDGGLHFTLVTFLVIIMGGMTNFMGAFVGGLIIGISESVGSVYVSGNLGMIFPYALFVAVVLYRPSGLLTRSNS